MKIALAGAYGKLGSDILKVLVENGHNVNALDMSEKEIEGLNKKKVHFYKIDVTNPSTLKGTLDGCEVVISTVGLTATSAKLTNYDIDYQGNLNILEEAKKSKVKKFIYISVIRADEDKSVPMLHAKYLFEEKLKESGLSYIIYRPTGYFYDFVKAFRPMIEKGTVNLLGKKDYQCNVIDTIDFANYIVDHIKDDNVITSIGGKESYTYKELAELCFKAANKDVVIKRAPAFLFTILIHLPKNKKNGKSAVLRFFKFINTHDLVGDVKTGENSFKKYIFESFKN